MGSLFDFSIISINQDLLDNSSIAVALFLRESMRTSQIAVSFNYDCILAKDFIQLVNFMSLFSVLYEL